MDAVEQIYIVYLGEHMEAKSKEVIQEDHHALLLSVKGRYVHIIQLSTST